jgi:hypothetical protein
MVRLTSNSESFGLEAGTSPALRRGPPRRQSSPGVDSTLDTSTGHYAAPRLQGAKHSGRRCCLTQTDDPRTA